MTEAPASRQHLMVFGAHPVDPEITCGPVIAKYTRAGHRATIVYLTLGEAGNPSMPPEQYKEQKRREVAEAAAVLGAEYVVLPYPDSDLPLNQEARLAVCDLLRERRPDIVITHWSHSFSGDHTAAYHLVLDGVRLAASPRITRALPPYRVPHLYVAENWEDPFGFQPEVYIDVTDTYDIWLEAARKHELVRGGILPFPYLEYYTALARVRGAEVGVQYAKAFMRVRERRERYAFFPV